MNFEAFCKQYQHRIQAYLTELLNSAALEVAPQLQQAMAYSVLQGGKRLRPLLVYATGLAYNAEPTHLDTIAASIELLHSYSLIHDDLPCMDDDNLRRGQPTCHIAFDEATAILAGDALQSLAFEHLFTLTDVGLAPTLTLKISQALATAVGPKGMVAGQMVDLNSEHTTLKLGQIQALHSCKTGALFSACMQTAAIAAGVTATETLTKLDSFGLTLGLAFQIQDDILDVAGSTAMLGKAVGQDQSHYKATYPALLGLDQARTHADKMLQQALDILTELDLNNSYLVDLAQFSVNRQH